MADARLPDEIMMLIFDNLRPRDLAAVARTCRAWSRLATDDALWRRPCVDAGWNSPPSACARPACGWRAAAQRLAVGSVLVLYTSVSSTGRALNHATSIVVRARRSVSQVAGAVCATIERRGPIRLTSFWVPERARGSAADRVTRWRSLGACGADMPLAALDAVAWEAPTRGLLRLSDSPSVRAVRVRASTWLLTCDAGAGDSPVSARRRTPSNVQFTHVVRHGRDRSGAWVDVGAGTLLWQRQAYSGAWRRGRREGSGTQSYGDGGRYVGEWRDGLCHGAGRYDDSKGGGYEGRWRRGYPQGRGCRWWPDGQVHDGAFVAGRPHGPGTLIAPNGMRAVGTWRDGVAHGVQWVSPFGPMWVSPPFGLMA
ncbi:Morn repeat protein [Pandoravirus kuranda]|uniref:Morn repeat protein n=1 Tax=Pandoravirus kuranda TaxID=3019033 RepID=A0AA95EDB8_9VIRU|nr:Morn repeat protein [Pandoravirus kuranda]